MKASSPLFVNPIPLIRALEPVQRRTFIAAFLGWALDAFDFFLITFVLRQLSTDFAKTIPTVAFAITVTLMFRPLGALIFGMFADRFGRKTPLMINIVIYSFLELLTAFSPNFTIFLVLRALYGIAMGGEWGVGAALALESLPVKSRGLFSGILQQGYASGYLFAAIANFFIVPHFGWRGMFVVGALPAFLVLYIRSQVPESPVWLERRSAPIGATGNLFGSFLRQPILFIYAILLMTAFNFMSHGSQDLYPTFLREQHHFNTGAVSAIAIIANLGAIVGGTFFGGLSQTLGRKKTIVLCSLLGMCVIPLWMYAPTTALLAAGGFLIQVCVQGAWGVVPIHLNELSPGDVRGTFPGFTYQIGNLISAGAAQIEAAFAAGFKLPDGGANYAHALTIIMLVVFASVAILAAIGFERRAVSFTSETA